MNADLTHKMSDFSRLKVLVIGEAMLDSYLEGTTERLCREAPVPVVNLVDCKNAPGGAANTAVNLCRLGSQVNFLSVVGDDPEGLLLRQTLREQGVKDDYVLVCPARQTLAKRRVLAASQMIVRIDQGSTGPVDPVLEQKLIETINKLLPACEAVIVSDYGYGLLTPRVIDALAEWQACAPRVLVVDAKNLQAYREVGATAVKPNYDEVSGLLGLDKSTDRPNRAELIEVKGEQVLDITGAQIAAITIDTEGALIFERGSAPYRTYARPVAYSKAAGAGDTYVSALSLALAAGMPTTAAAELASAAAAIVVAKDGTATCSLEELNEFFLQTHKCFDDLERLVRRLDAYREQGQRIVFTNGCFDLLHRGHVTYLSQAKALGDILVVGLNSDKSVKRLKGTGRPINGLEDRIQVLAALSCVDFIIPFEENTPVELIRAIRPDVFVKGGDYRRDKLPEAGLVEELGGEVQLLPFLSDRSTTGTIERIYRLYNRQTRKLA